MHRSKESLFHLPVAGHAIFLEFEPETDIVKVERDSVIQLPEKLNESHENERAETDNGDHEDENGDSEASYFFGDGKDDSMSPPSFVISTKTNKILRTAAGAEISESNPPKKRRRNVPGAYKRKYDRKFHRNYSEYQ